jgi:hypothetical protein
MPLPIQEQSLLDLVLAGSVWLQTLATRRQATSWNHADIPLWRPRHQRRNMLRHDTLFQCFTDSF